MKFSSYWLDSAPPFRGGITTPAEGRADVVIVGGGFTGLSAALSLARKGASVIVLEAGRVVGEGSGRNGGQCNNGTAHDFAGLSATLGLGRARELYQAFDAGVDAVERLVMEERIDCGFTRCGKIKLAAKPAHFDKLARTADILAREVDPSVRLLTPEALTAEVGSPIFHGGLLFPRSARMHMGRFGVGLAEAAARRPHPREQPGHRHRPPGRGPLPRLHGGRRPRRSRPGPGGDRRLHPGAVRLVPAADRAGRQLHRRHRSIVPVGPGRHHAG